MNPARLLSLTLLPASLVAQAPQAAPAPAPSLEQALSSATPGIQAQMKEDPDKALAMVEALIPAKAPVFDATDPKSVHGSIVEQSALVKVYSLAANAASDAGRWEDSRDYATKAKEAAKGLYADAQPALRKQQDAWKGALDKSQKATEEAKALEVKTPRTPEEDKILDLYNSNKAIHEFNLKNGPAQVQAIEKNISNLEAQTHDFDSFLENVDKRLKLEAEDLEKVKGVKSRYVASGLAAITKSMEQEKALNLLRRFKVLDPANKAVAHRIDVLLGKAKDTPAKSIHRKKKG